MKLSLNWLAEFIHLPNISPEALADIVTEHAFEVEAVEYPHSNKKFSGVFAAKVLDIQKHPNADRLRIVSLDLGGTLVEPVVCGANNFGIGQTVCLALPGAYIPADVHNPGAPGFVLEKAKIRGVESQGMICSAYELGMSTEPEALPEILLLDPITPSGIDLQELFGEKNGGAVFDISLPANRADLFSQFGIARELHALLGYRVTKLYSMYESLHTQKLPTAKKISVKISEKKACPFYIGSRIRVLQSPSEPTLADKLIQIGNKPINTIVDITNYVMYEIGEPMHAFDAHKIVGTIEVRYAKQGEKIVTIDHKERLLDAQTLVIADSNGPIAIAGIMGGLTTEISEATTEIILEAANFEPTGIRRTSKYLGLRADGSGLWEKGLQPEQACMATIRAIELLKLYAHAELLEIGVFGSIHDSKRELSFTADQINTILGTTFSTDSIKGLLKHMPFKLSGARTLKAHIPYFRPDIEDHSDIADEILRIAGINNIEKKPLVMTSTAELINKDQPFMQLKQQMVELGFSEVQNYSFISAEDAQKFAIPIERLVKIKNPLSSDQVYLKQQLLIPLLKNIATNSKNFNSINLFELGKEYHGYLAERDVLSCVVYDISKDSQQLFLEVKSTIERLSTMYNIVLQFVHLTDTSMELRSDTTVVGTIGVISSAISANYDIRQPVAFAELYIEPFLQMSKKTVFKVYPKFPQSIRDLSIIVDSKVSWKQIEDQINAVQSPLIQSVELFEASFLYTSKMMPKFHTDLAAKGLKNLAFHIIFGSSERTLTDSDISPIYAKIVEGIKTKLYAEIR